MSHVGKFQNFYVCMQKRSLLCDFLLPTVLNCIVQPFSPGVAVDNRSYFSFLNAHACTCMDQHFPICPWKLRFTGCGHPILLIRLISDRQILIHLHG